MTLNTNQFGNISSHHEQPDYHHIKMFMSANEILDTHQPNPGDIETDEYTSSGSVRENAPPETHEQFWSRKTDEAYNKGLIDSVQSGGVKQPVNVYRPKYAEAEESHIGQGHHRVAAAKDVDANALMPVLHHDNKQDALHGGYPGSRDQRWSDWQQGDSEGDTGSSEGWSSPPDNSPGYSPHGITAHLARMDAIYKGPGTITRVRAQLEAAGLSLKPRLNLGSVKRPDR